MVIFSGELLHSYILRVLKSSGYLKKASSLHNIISPKGKWAAYPLISDEYRHLFSHLSKVRLLELVELHTQAHLVRLTSAPSVFASLSEHIFEGKRQIMKLDDISVDTYKYKRPIKYCKHCFGEQINLYGVAWFPLVWLEADKCPRHSIKLEDIGCPRCTKQNLINKLTSTLEGRCLDCNEQLWSTTDFSKFYGQFNINKPSKDILRLNPCVFWEFVSFLKLEYKRLLKLQNQESDVQCIAKLKSGVMSQKIFDLINVVRKVEENAIPLTKNEESDLKLLKKFPKVIYKSGIHKEFDFPQSVHLLHSTHEKLPILFEKFWGERLEKVVQKLRYPFNYCQKEMVKSKNRECRTCHLSYEECIGSLIIYRKRIGITRNIGRPDWCEEAMKKEVALF